MKVTHDSGATAHGSEFTFVPAQHHNNNNNVNHHHPHSNHQQMMYPAGCETSFNNDPIVSEILYHQIMTPIADEASSPSIQPNYSQPSYPSHHSFYQQHSYSQPELQRISQLNMSSHSLNESDIKEENEEEVTIESILEDDPLLSFTTTLDRQESNDTILQSSSPIKGPEDAPYFEIEHLNLNHQNHSQASLIQKDSPERTIVPPPMNNFPTPANSTSSTGVNSNQSPNNGAQFPQQQFTNSRFSSQPQQFQPPPQTQFMTHSNNTAPSLPIASEEPFVPPTNTAPVIMKIEPNVKQQQQQQIPIQNFRMQIQNQAFFQPQFRNPPPQQQPPPLPPQLQQQPAPISEASLMQLQQQVQNQQLQHQQVPPPPLQPFVGKHTGPSPIQNVGTPLASSKATSTAQTIHTPVTIKSQELKLPPTPPPVSQPPLNKSSSTTKLSKVKKNSVSGPSTSTLKLKKSKSFLNSSPSMKDSKPFFTTLDFSKQYNANHNTFINKDKKFPKTAMKVNVIKNYEFVLEQGHEKVKNSSSSNSAKSTPRRPSIAGTPTSATSIKFPKLPKPPPIEKTSFSMYSPTNPNSSPTNSDASGQSPLNSSQPYPMVNASPIPSSIARFDNGDANINNTSSPITNDQIFFRPISTSKRSSISQTSPEKQPSPPYHRDMKSGMNEFKIRTNK